MTRYILLLSFCFSMTMGNAQNLVPNPSFEKVQKVSVSWISNDTQFENRMDHWTTPNLGSPDIFFNKLMGKFRAKRKGVELTPHKARTGVSMVAVKTYGCATMTQHCKEYIQVKLKKNIKSDKQYYIEFWVNQMSTSPATNNMGLAFSDVEIQDNSEYGLHYFDPVALDTTLIQNAPNDWCRIAATVTADRDYDYIVIGNFFTDDETKYKQEEGDISYGYYFIDDVLVRPLKRDPDLDLADADIEVGTTIALNNIHFQTAKSDLLPSSFTELNKLVSILNDNPKIKIQINGHTDNQGAEAYNLELSKKRAESVVKYLQTKGISSERLQHQGYGMSQPLASNDNSEGQQLNRRVEFLVLSK